MPRTEINPKILVVADFLAFMKKRVRQLMRDGEAFAGKRMGAVDADNRPRSVAYDQAGNLLEIHWANDNALPTDDIVDGHGRLINTSFPQQTVGKLLDAWVARLGAHHRFSRARAPCEMIERTASRTEFRHDVILPVYRPFFFDWKKSCGLHAKGDGDIQELVQQHRLPAGFDVGDGATRKLDSRRKLQLSQPHRGAPFAHLRAERLVDLVRCLNSRHVRYVDSR